MNTKLGCEMFGSQVLETGCDTSLQQKQVKINFMKKVLTGETDKKRKTWTLVMKMLSSHLMTNEEEEVFG